MRAIIFAAALALTPAVANAQSATVSGGSGSTLDGYHIAAISAGAVGGLIVANMLTGGMATPVVAGAVGDGALLTNGSLWFTSISEAAVTAFGAIGGGYVGDWLYSQ
jgi:hypothetical protein